MLVEHNVVVQPDGTALAICNGMPTEVRLPPRPEDEKDTRSLAFRGPHGNLIPIPGEHVRLKSRFILTKESALIDGLAGRFTWHSVVGLVVGAMGGRIPGVFRYSGDSYHQ